MLYGWLITAAVFSFSPAHSLPEVLSRSTRSDNVIPCDKGWFLFREKCLIVKGKSRSGRNYYDDAASHCNKVGGNLVTIQSKEEIDFIVTYMLLEVYSPVWIGLRRRGNSEEFTWEDGSPVNYTHWMKDKPSNNSDENCVMMEFQLVTGITGLWNNVKCNGWRAYVCQKKINLRKKSQNPEYCSAEQGGGRKLGNSCYHLVMERKTWDDAERYCVDKHKGHLVTVLDEGVDLYLDYILADIHDAFWIGIKISNEVQPKWISGWFIWFAAYNQTDQDSGGATEETCILRRSRDYWPTAPCNGIHPFICETTKVLPPVLDPPPKGSHCPEIPNDWIDLGGEYCYFFEGRNEFTWYEANFECNRRGGQLLSLHSQEESDIIQPFVKFLQEGKFIGLVRQTSNEHNFIWSDGTDMDYENWSYMEPSNPTEKCAEIWMATAMEWNDVWCDSKRGYFCHVKKVTPNAQIDASAEYDCSTSKCYVKEIRKHIVFH